MKRVRIRSAIPLYLAALVWLLAGLIFPSALLRLGTLVVVAALSALAYAAGTKFFPGREIEVRERADSGDRDWMSDRAGRAQIDRLARSRQRRSRRFRALERMVRAGTRFSPNWSASGKGEQARFLNYYLPASEKLVANYPLADAPAKGENIRSGMRAVEGVLETVAAAFEKQLDSLYRDTSFDMETEVSVIETLLAGEGLTGGGIDRRSGAPKA